MRFGLFGSATARHGGPDVDSGLGYKQFVDYNIEAEALGYHSTFLVEHHFTGAGQVSASLSLLTWLAAKTRTLRLGTAVLVLPWHNPVLLAEQAATIDLLSGGRLDFGVGKGYRHNEFAGFCVPIEEADALAGIRDGSIVLIGGFGSIGQPNALIYGLIEQGAKDLTVVANNAGVGHIGLARLMEVGRVRKIICSYPRTTDPVVFEQLYREGRVELEVMPQGTMAERMRAAGAGIPAFYTPTSVGTKLAEGKELREFSGRQYVLEEAFFGDVALVEAWEADRWGNLTYRSSARNFNPVMATAAKLTIAQAQHIVELGELDPEKVGTPGIYVNRVVHVPYGEPTVT